MLFEQRWPGLFRQVRKPSIPKILIEQRPILIANVYTEPVNLGIGVAVDQQKVFPAVIVEIKEAATPANKASVVSQSGALRSIVKLAVATIVVQSFAFVRKIAAKQVQRAIAVVVACRTPCS